MIRLRRLDLHDDQVTLLQVFNVNLMKAGCCVFLEIVISGAIPPAVLPLVVGKLDAQFA